MADTVHKAIILGCSHAHGDEIWLGEGEQPATQNLQDLPRLQDFGLRHSFASQIANRLNLLVCNHAIGGGSNDAMFRVWMELQDNLVAGDVVIACWTGRHRTEIWHSKDQLWLPISPGARRHFKRSTDALHLQGRTIGQIVQSNDDYARFIDQWHVFANDAASALNNKIKNIVALNSMAAEKNIRVINIHAFDPVHCDWFARFEWPVIQDFCGFCEEKKYQRTKMGHYFRNAHTDFADFVVSRLHV